jgi:hypothetical protein
MRGPKVTELEGFPSNKAPKRDIKGAAPERFHNQVQLAELFDSRPLLDTWHAISEGYEGQFMSF